MPIMGLFSFLGHCFGNVFYLNPATPRVHPFFEMEGTARAVGDQKLRAGGLHIFELSLQHRRSRLGIEEDVSFHMAIAYATKNLAQVHLMRTFYDLLHFGIRENLHHLYTEPGNLEIIDAQHRAVLAAIQHHDPEAAFTAMKLHITFVLDFVRASA